MIIGFVILLLVIILCVSMFLCIALYRLIKKLRRRLNNDEHILFVLRKWDERISREEKFLVNQLKQKKYRIIAIYGCGIIGRKIERELRESEIKVSYFIDRNAANLYSVIPIYLNTDVLPPVDIIIITAVSQFYEIRQELMKRIACPIISIEDLL